MNALLRNISSQVIRQHKLFVVPCSRFATDPKIIEEMTKKNKVVVFMKVNDEIFTTNQQILIISFQGIPDAPKCGFSNAVVQIMRMHGVEYDAHDVLASEDIRQGIKDFTNWPTIPQVFIGGEFVGGCDILLQMHQSGDLIDVLHKQAGIKSSLAEDPTKDEKK